MFTKNDLREELKKRANSIIDALSILYKESEKSETSRSTLHLAIQIMLDKKKVLEESLLTLLVEQNDFAVFFVSSVMGYEPKYETPKESWESLCNVFRDLWLNLPAQFDNRTLQGTFLNAGTETFDVDTFINQKSTIVLDLGDLKKSLVGQTSDNMKKALDACKNYRA